MKYILLDALLTKIEKRKKEWSCGSSTEAKYKVEAYKEVIELLNTLEVKEVGVDLGDPKGDKSAKYIIDTKNLEVKEVDLKEEYDNEFFKDPVFSKLVNRNAGISIAKHFFELGLKAQK